jgi:hypothetical protein
VIGLRDAQVAPDRLGLPADRIDLDERGDGGRYVHSRRVIRIPLAEAEIEAPSADLTDRSQACQAGRLLVAPRRSRVSGARDREGCAAFRRFLFVGARPCRL